VYVLFTKCPTMLMQKGFGIGTYEIPVSFQKKQIELLIYT
jgi:hypothetical protein